MRGAWFWLRSVEIRVDDRSYSYEGSDSILPKEERLLFE